MSFSLNAVSYPNPVYSTDSFFENVVENLSLTGKTRKTILWRKYTYTFQMMTTRTAYNTFKTLQQTSENTSTAITFNYTSKFAQTSNISVYMEVSDPKFERDLPFTDASNSDYYVSYSITFTEINPR